MMRGCVYPTRDGKEVRLAQLNRRLAGLVIEPLRARKMLVTSNGVKGAFVVSSSGGKRGAWRARGIEQMLNLLAADSPKSVGGESNQMKGK